MFAREKQGAVYWLGHCINVRISYCQIMIRICALCEHVFFPSRYMSRFREGHILKVKFQMV